MFGTPEQDRKFRSQMAQIQAVMAPFRFLQIGALFYKEETDEFYISPEVQTGKGPWTSSTEYYDDIVSHILKSVPSTLMASWLHHSRSRHGILCSPASM